MKKIVVWSGIIISVLVVGAFIVMFPVIKGTFFLTEMAFDDQLSVFTTMTSGNSAVLTSKDNRSVIIIDTKQGNDAEKLFKKIQRRSPDASITIISTHTHYDHTGGNRLYKEAFLITGAIGNEQWSREADSIKYPDYRLPKGRDTSIILDDEIVQIKALSSAHTDGDILVLFEKRGILCTGDQIFEGMHPVVSKKFGSDVNGWLSNLDTLISLAPVKVVPGHGVIGSSSLLVDQKNYFISIRDALADERAMNDLRKKYKKYYSIPDLADFDNTVAFLKEEIK
jgi:glyoxylase-like metal-dependent hydrolase (beta-lactamase superfamily II)